ncbi:MAG: hypothetical protein KUA43_05175 [Hoeflea sp.]|uniref:hypothetical protein n=1 Tax=Hoeflea sp. TaxID=1940281 RepID=UPI001DA40305|nr:hypothetical protein [Hoeflea sp.]MBU4530923.1 hypothetical protein [Alphaproteobacteria bacterium]MBU4542698.1 hypothetical protein [Alphaproteobacteria bacterium]MBU4549375.1 hypothetical protein [Alphaproteobacteria bacterium]MBV1722815.1 hypothetical protein [Hoeflea sp.]MBV1761537.1 hypothetical protein [Hoeflea sp.]
MFPMWNDTDKKSDETTARLRDLEARMDAYLLQKRGKPSCELVRAVADAREKVREAMRPKESMAG